MNDIIINSDLLIDMENLIVRKNGTCIHFGMVQFSIIYLLATNKGKIISWENLLTPDVAVTPGNIRVHIKRIRDKIDCDIIETISGKGYRIPAWPNL